MLLLGLPVFPSLMTDASVVQAAEASDLLHINTATADQLKVLPVIGDLYSERPPIADRTSEGRAVTEEGFLSWRQAGAVLGKC